MNGHGFFKHQFQHSLLKEKCAKSVNMSPTKFLEARMRKNASKNGLDSVMTKVQELNQKCKRDGPTSPKTSFSLEMLHFLRFAKSATKYAKYIQI